jgi:3-hydroxyisobutyrate dehydrogenase
MLPNGAIVESVYSADVIGHAPKLRRCCSIARPSTSILPARSPSAASAAGYAMVDAPVSGGIAAANGGTLTFMVGGSDEAFARAEPILAAMGKAVIHAGASGAGQAAKICNNMILGATMIATCEAFALAEKLGLDLQTFYRHFQQGLGPVWSMTSYCPVPGVGPASPADNGYQGGFAAALMLKDLKLAMEAAQSVGAQVPMGTRAEELYQAFHRSRVTAGTDFSGDHQDVVGLFEPSLLWGEGRLPFASSREPKSAHFCSAPNP